MVRMEENCSEVLKRDDWEEFKEESRPRCLDPTDVAAALVEVEDLEKRTKVTWPGCVFSFQRFRLAQT